MMGARSLDWTGFGRGPIPWDDVEAHLPLVAEMRACVQDPVFHAEGDVWTHTRAVCEALFSGEGWRAADAERRPGLAWAALLHDWAKPRTREEAFDTDLGRVRVTHRGHSLKGARMAWAFMWRQGVAHAVRLQAYHLILWHQRVFHLLEQEDPRRDLARFSVSGRWDELIALAQADNAGRIAPNQADTRDTLTLTAMLAEEHGCLSTPWHFPSDEGRVSYVRRGGSSPFHEPMPAAGSRVTVLSGLPGAGKDTYAARNLPGVPTVSLDDMRARLGIAPGGNDGRAIVAAYEAARVHLRAGTAFVWNATNLTRLQRDKIIDLCLDYGARVEIHALDRPERVTASRNRDRPARVPDRVVERMVENWEPPSEAEAHALRWV